MSETPLFDFTADAAYADRLARAQWRDQRRNAAGLSAFALAVLAIIVIQVIPVFIGVVASLAALVFVVELTIYLQLRRAARRSFPEGHRFSIEYRDSALRYVDDDGDSVLPYGHFSTVRIVRPDFVALVRRGQPAIVLPVAVCPAEARAIVRAGIEAPDEPELDPDDYTHHATAGPEFLRAASQRSLELLATDPASLGLVAAIVVVGVGFALALADPVPAVFALLLVILWPIVVVISVRGAARRQVGTFTLYARFDDDVFVTAGRGAVTSTRYDVFDRMDTSRGAVELRVASSGEWHLYPIGLIPEDERARFSSVGSARPTPDTPE